jgi:hypothetical protein
MQSVRIITTFLMLAVLVFAMTVIQGCGREPEPEVSRQEGLPETEEIPFKTLELPQTNTSVGISVTKTPANVFVTYNGEYWIELTNSKVPNCRYTFVSDPSYLPGVSVANARDFESEIFQYLEGQFNGKGQVDTPIGSATWFSGSFEQDGDAWQQVLMEAPHPSGNGSLFLTAIYPAGATTVDQSLAVMNEIVSNIV